MPEQRHTNHPVPIYTYTKKAVVKMCTYNRIPMIHFRGFSIANIDIMIPGNQAQNGQKEQQIGQKEEGNLRFHKLFRSLAVFGMETF